MPTIRTLVRPWQPRQHAFASIFVSRLLNINACRLDAQGRSCHGHVTSRESSILRSPSHDTCGQDVDHSEESHVTLSAPGNDGFVEPCRPDATCLVDLQVCKQHVKVPTCKQHALSSHIYPSTQGLETFGSTRPQTLKPCTRQNGLKRRSHDTVLYGCNADDSALAPASKSKVTKCLEALYSPSLSQTPNISIRSKKSQCGAALHQKLSLLESEHYLLCDATILRKSRLFKSTSFEHLAAVLKVLEKTLGSSENAVQALAANSGLLSQPIEVLEQKLKVMADFGITEAVVRKLWTYKHPLPLKVESLHKRLSFFKENGLNAEALSRLLYRQPEILQRSPECILNVVSFLKSLGLDQEDLLRSMQKNPSFLLVSCDKLREKYAFFQQLGFSENEYTKTLHAGLPGLSIEKFQASTKLLKDQGFSDSDVHRLISQQPSILTLNLETLKSKLDFLLCKQKYGTADIVKFPFCLISSLQGRIIPRFKLLEEKGLSKVYRLSTIMSYNELRFQELVRKKQKKVDVRF